MRQEAAEPLVTIVVVPREQFSKTRQSLESVFARTSLPFALVYVDGNSPPPIRRYLEAAARERGFTLLRTERYLAANEARNLALPRARTKYTVFLDNDIEVTEGWLEALVACAEETGAGAVSPLYLLGDPARREVHTAGGDLRIVDDGGVRRFHEYHHHAGKNADAVADQLVRRRIDLLEFHCALARTDVVRRLMPFDEALVSFFDHDDFCLDLQAMGEAVYAEPKSVVAHLSPPPLAASDRRYFLLRWSNAWLEPSLRRFAAKHGVLCDDATFAVHRGYRDDHRRRLYAGFRRGFQRVFGYRALMLLDGLDRFVFDTLAERALVLPLDARRTRPAQVAEPAVS